MAAEREQAVHARAISERRQRDWLMSTRNHAQTTLGKRRVLGELEVIKYLVDGSSYIDFTELSD